MYHNVSYMYLNNYNPIHIISAAKRPLQQHESKTWKHLRADSTPSTAYAMLASSRDVNLSKVNVGMFSSLSCENLLMYLLYLYMSSWYFPPNQLLRVGRNPAPGFRYFKVLHYLWSQYSQDFIHPRWRTSSSIGTISCLPSFCMTAADMTSFNSSPASRTKIQSKPFKTKG